MQYTSSLNLKKPEGTDVVDINVLNENTDIIDMEITKKATQTLDGRMSKEDKKKLDGVEEGANNYTHPSTHAATMVTITDTGNNFSSTNVEGALSELFTSVSDGKQQIATAITDVDNSLNPSGSDTFMQLANTIRNISTGSRVASGVANAMGLTDTFETVAGRNFTQNYIVVSGLTFTPKVIICFIYNHSNNMYSAVYHKDARYNNYSYILVSGEEFKISGNSYINATGFRIPVSGNYQHAWYAVE